MAFYKIWASRVKSPVENFVGDNGRLFYDDSDGIIRIGDGTTVGGVPLIDSNLIGTGGSSGTTNGNVYIEDFPLNGNNVVLTFSTYNIQNLLGFEILDSNNQIVDVLYTLESDRLIVDSNVDLLNHTLRVVHFR